MTLAPVDDNGTQLYFEDSGPPVGSATYTTVVVIHGTYFNCGIFKPMFPFAAVNNLRIVLLHQRDYSGSTLYTKEELDMLRSSDKETQMRFLKDRVRELATFLEWFISHEDVPPLDALGIGGRRTGGISIIGWSAGSSMTIPIVAFSGSIPKMTRELLGRYLRSLVIYDPPYYSTGVRVPTLEELYCPVRDTSLSPAELGEQFPRWVSGYYTHAHAAMTSLVPPSPPTLLSGNGNNSYHDCNAIQSSSDFLRSLTSTYDSKPLPTTLRIPKETLQKITDPESFPRSQVFILLMNQEIFSGCMNRLLFNDVQEGEQTTQCTASNGRHVSPLPAYASELMNQDLVWEQMKVEIVSCAKSPGDCVYTAWEMERLLNRRVHGCSTHDEKKDNPSSSSHVFLNGERMRSKREVRVHILREFNHMAQWDQPEELTRFFGEIV